MKKIIMPRSSKSTFLLLWAYKRKKIILVFSMKTVNFIKRSVLSNIFFVFLATGCFSLFTLAVHAQGNNSVEVIVIDPGHGGKDPGCNGKFALEKDISLAVSLKLKAYMEKYIPGVKVYLTRDKDEFIELEERAQTANRLKADLFISIHCNAAGKPVIIKDPKTGKPKVKMRKNSRGKWIPVETINSEPYGTETYVMGIKNEEGKMQVAMRENAAIYLEDDYEKKYEGFDPDSEESYIIMSNFTSALVIRSAMLAMKMQEDYRNFAGRTDKGVHRQSIWVLWRTSMPSVLTELGYLTNPLEEKFLASDKGQDYLAKCISRAVRRYKAECEGKKYNYDDELEKMQPLENENVLAEMQTKNSSAVTDTIRENRKYMSERKTENQDNYTSVEENKKTSDQPAPSALADQKTSSRERSNFCDTLSDSMPVYKVQFKTSSEPLDIKMWDNKGLICPHYYLHNQQYKYVSGAFLKMKDAAEHQKELMDKGFKDCFIIAFYKGKRISLEEARQKHLYSGNP